MRILYFYRGRENYHPAWDSLRKSLSEIANVTQLEAGLEYDGEKLVRQINPEILVIGASSIRTCKLIRNLDKVKIPKVIYTIHEFIFLDDYIKFINDKQIDLVMTTDLKESYLGKVHSCLVKNCFPSVDENHFKDYGLKRKWDVYYSGLNKFRFSDYPLRVKIVRSLLQKPNIKSFVTFDFTSPLEYAKELSQAKITAFGNSIYHALTMRMTQAWASKTLVMCDMPKVGLEAGMKPNYNFVEINEENFLEKIEYYLKNEKERKRIIENGYVEVINHHTSDIRAKELLKLFEEII